MLPPGACIPQERSRTRYRKEKRWEQNSSETGTGIGIEIVIEQGIGRGRNSLKPPDNMQVTQLYRERIPEDAAVLDLMSSWVSHLPQEKKYARVVGHGMNAAEVSHPPALLPCVMLPQSQMCLPRASFGCKEGKHLWSWEGYWESLKTLWRLQAGLHPGVSRASS